MEGGILQPLASPSLRSVFVEALKNVPSSKDESESYYEFLKNYYKDSDDGLENSIEDRVKILGAGSDHAPFAYYAGVPALYYFFTIDKKKYPGYSGKYPTYHTGYETFYLMDKLLDPGFKLHKTCSQLSIHMLLQLAESAILPLQPEEIVREVEKALGKMEKNNVTKTLVDNGAGTAYTSMKQSFQKFKLSVNGWAEKKVTLENSHEITDFPRYY